MCLMIATGQTLFSCNVRNSICKIFFSSEKILVYTICTIYDFTDSGNTVAELYFIRKTKTFKQLESFDNPCNIFTFELYGLLSFSRQSQILHLMPQEWMA